jgi:hypothetical protein
MWPITTLFGKGATLSPTESDQNIRELDRRTAMGWKDMVSALTIEGVPEEFAPTYLPFGPSGLRRELAFQIGDYAFAKPFHVNHDMMVGGKALLHVHWSTDGVDTAPVRWEFQVSRALGHQQAYFTAETSLFVEQAGWNGAWRHMVAEVAIGDALIMTEPDELILVTLRRVSNGSVNNTNDVFGLIVDLHYESDRDTTPNRLPDFYAEAP